MITIPRDIFLKIQKNKTIHEDSEPQYSDDDLLKKIASMDFTRLSYWLYEYKYISYVGSGSSRTAFILNDGRCLKVAKNQKGLAQNKAEYEATVKLNGNGKYTCFSQIYAADTETWKSMIVEAATEVYAEDFEALLQFDEQFDSVEDQMAHHRNIDAGIATDAVLYAMVFKTGETLANLKSSDPNKFLTQFNKYRSVVGHSMIKEQFVDSEIVPIARNIINAKITETRTNGLHSKPEFSYMNLKSLVRFYEDHGTKIVTPGDLYQEENWGMTDRGNGAELIIIDAGLSEEVYNQYYA